MWASFDYSSWPIISIVLDQKPKSFSEFKDYLSKCDLMYEDNENIWLVIDAINVESIQYQYVLLQAEHMLRTEKTTSKYMKRCAVITNQKTQKLIKMLFQIRTPSCPFQIFNSKELALKWISEDPILSVSETVTPDPDPDRSAIDLFFK
jgi:hypothetical protein